MDARPNQNHDQVQADGDGGNEAMQQIPGARDAVAFVSSKEFAAKYNSKRECYK